jgi:hypothetical protein
MTNWTEGQPDQGRYDRYGDSPWYDVPKGWELVVEHDWRPSKYEFSMLVVWRNAATRELRAAVDSGCSSPMPFGDLTPAGMKSIRAVEDLASLLSSQWIYGSSHEDLTLNSQDERVAKIKAAVHRALRED